MSASPPSIPRQPKRLLPRLLVIAAFVAFALVVTCVIAFAVWRNGIRKEIEGQIAAIRKAGQPTNWEELSRWPAVVPDAENAAFIYTNAIAQIRSNSISWEIESELSTRGTPLSEKARVAAEQAVATNQAALDIARRSTLLPRARYPVNYLDGPNAELPHLAGLKQLAKLLEYEAVLKADAGDANGAVESVNTSIRAARSLDNEPLLISQLVAAAMLTMSCQSLERVLCRTSTTDEGLRGLMAQLHAAEATNRFQVALVGERAQTMELIRLLQDDVRHFIEIANKNSSEEERVELPVRNPGVGWKMIGFFDRDRAFFLRAMDTNLAILTLAPPRSLQFSNHLEQMDTRALKGHFIFSSMTLSGLKRIPTRDASLHAYLRATMAAIAVERWRVAHAGSLPESLDALVPDLLPSIPIDPFDGQPLRYKLLPRGFAVYSVGPNQRDDYGREKPSRRQKTSREDRERFDIVFTVER